MLNSAGQSCNNPNNHDIKGIEWFVRIWERDVFIHIGAAVTDAEVAKNPIVLKGADILAWGCSQIGSPWSINRLRSSLISD